MGQGGLSVPPSGRHGSMEHSQHARHEPSSNTGDPSATDPASFWNESAIQTMMRNNTTPETGNVGHYSGKQHRMPSPMSGSFPGSSKRPRAGHRDHSQPLPHLHQGSSAGIGRRTPKMSRYGAMPPSPGSGPPPPSPASYRDPSRGPSMDEYRSYSMTQSSYVSHSLTNRHPYINGTQYARGNLQQSRPRSPFAYPTRLKRPGYRPSSPALTEFNRSMPGNDVDAGQSSRTASPASMYNMNRIPTPWQQVVNRSDPTLRYYPPNRGGPSGRASTPKPVPSLHSVESSLRLSQSQPPYPGAWPPSQPSTPPPLFYDYTEAFEEQTHIHRLSVSVISSPLPSPEDGLEEYFEQDAGPNIEYVSELASEDLPVRLPDSKVAMSGKRRSRSKYDEQPRAPTSYVQHQNLSMETSDLSPSSEELAVTASSTEDQDNAKGGLSSALTNFHPTNEARAVKVQEDETQGHPIEAEEHQKTTEKRGNSHDDSSSPPDSVYSAASSERLEHLDDSTAPTSGADTATASPEGPPRTPILGPRPGQQNRRLALDHMSEASKASKASASEKSIGIDYPEIIAPTPERSITSLSNRDRFSKILGLDEGFHELESLNEISQRRASKPSYVVNPESKTHRRLQDDLLPPDTADHTIVEETYSDDEHELSNDLLETFGRPNQDPLQELHAGKSVILSPRTQRESPTPLVMRNSPDIKKHNPTAVRMSHRKTVINIGQNHEAKRIDADRSTASIPKPMPDPAQPMVSAEERKTRIDKDLPPLPKPSPSIKSFAPPKSARKTDLPFAFTPLIQPRSEDDSLVELEATALTYLKEHESQSERGESPVPRSNPRLSRVSTASPTGSRPWNLDENYPWDGDEAPKLDIAMPLPGKDPQQSTEKYPKFKLRIHRASSSSTGTNKLTKKHRSSEDTLSSVLGSSADLIKAASFKHRVRPSLTINAPGQSNSSHDVIRPSPMQTRFVESFEQPSQTSPTITLAPPSPGHDVRSFFSDDSSQARPKGSLRKRFSDFRARNSRANSVDGVQGYDRGLLNSAFGISRASGRSSRQSQNTAGAPSHRSRTKHVPWNVFGKVKSWFTRGEDKVRDWKWKRHYRNQVNRDESRPLYAGV